jgi:hypothetical protein
MGEGEKSQTDLYKAYFVRLDGEEKQLLGLAFRNELGRNAQDPVHLKESKGRI